MAARIVWALSVLASSAHAFKDASPFLAFSTSKLPQLDQLQEQDEQVAQHSQITKVLNEAFEGCPSDAYVFIHQSGLSAEDLQDPSAVPYLTKRMKGGYGVKSTVVIPEVADLHFVESARAPSECGTTTAVVDPWDGFIDINDHWPHTISLRFPPLPQDKSRREKLIEHDSMLHYTLNLLEKHSYTVVFTTSPIKDTVNDQGQPSEEAEHLKYNYETEDPSLSALHQDLKRDSTGHLHQRRQQDEKDYDPALFEKYNFLSPGIFMSLFTGIILFSILSVGMSGLASVKVSYMAFSKEMGPAAQKKQQQ